MANQKELYGGQDYGSEFEYDSEFEKNRAKRNDLAVPEKQRKTKLPSKTDVTNEYSKDEGQRQRFHILSLDAYSRHKKYVNDYILYYGGSRKEFARDTSKDRTDLDVIRENHQFLWADNESESSWEKQLAKKYWEKLFKEYCIADLSRYKENKIAMRWRIEKEVVSGKGQFICGNKMCEEKDGLRSWEVNFGYMEHGEKKNALVKLRLCPECSYKLNYHHRRKEIKRKASCREAPSPKRQKHTHSEKSKHKKHKHKHKKRDTEKESDDIEKPSSSKDTKGTGGKPEADEKESSESAIWSRPVKIVEEKSREEEFEDYFEDMFL